MSYKGAQLAYALSSTLGIELKNCVDVQVWAELIDFRMFGASFSACLQARGFDKEVIYYTAGTLGPWKPTAHHLQRILKPAQPLLDSLDKFDDFCTENDKLLASHQCNA
eukprot:TRINITY_DN11702_c0_g2_i1.p1 TRINITY_DN11702_c0_g2~~TRINITY_DN11702_c0_g2_i1.p1  ORF type:complete len:109 (+),score=27.28 TRINITY_DN11702_c0_g2_i1:288-614(+)